MLKIKSREFWLTVEYPLSYALGSNFKIDGQIKKLVGRDSCGSGGGCGVRDMSFVFKKEGAALAAKDRVDKSRIMFGKRPVKVKVSLNEILE